MTTKIDGQLEIDHSRGVIWFNSNKGRCWLRICRLGELPNDLNHIDITHMHGMYVEVPEEL